MERTRIVIRDIARQRTVPPDLRDTLLKGLIRAQLRLALRLSVIVAAGLGGLPLLFSIAHTHELLPWLLLGVLAYPFLFLIGYVYVRHAEQNERDFAALVKRDP